MYCYEENDDSAGKSHRTGMTRMTSQTGGAAASTDHTAGLYLLLCGRANARLASDKLEMIEYGESCRPLRRGDKVQVEGGVYTLTAADADGTHLSLDRPLALELPAGVQHGAPAVPPALANGKRGDVWVMLEQHSPQMNLDCQLLLLSMGAHKPALRLLQLPFELEAIRPEDLETRAVLRACYRLIKGMTAGCAKMQLELVEWMDLFVEHTRGHLVSHDISPTGCINAIFHDNRTVCAQVEEVTVRSFVDMGAPSAHLPKCSLLELAAQRARRLMPLGAVCSGRGARAALCALPAQHRPSRRSPHPSQPAACALMPQRQGGGARFVQ